MAAGDRSNPIIINTAEEFNYYSQKIWTYYNSHFKLGNNIDLSGINWQPFGNWVYQFTGSIDGNGYTITGLNMNLSGYDYVGLFGVAKYPAEFHNMKLENVNVAGNQFVGGLLGYGYCVVVDNSSVSGNIRAGGDAGGLIGTIGSNGNDTNRSLITNSYADVEVNIVAYSAFGGGLIGGIIAENTEVSHSFARGQVSGPVYLGGLVGSNNGHISESFSEVTVNNTRINSDVSFTGGLTGLNNGTVENSYAVGRVSGYNYIGGMVGDNGGSFKNVYVAMQQNVPRSGGLAFFNHGTIEQSYWNKETSNITIDVIDDRGGTVQDSAGLTSQEMGTEASYPGWNFDDIWTVDNQTYPTLQAAHLIDLRTDVQKLELRYGESLDFTIYANYSNGTRKSVDSAAFTSLDGLPGTTIAETGNGQLRIIAGQIAKGQLKVTYEGVTNYFDVSVIPGPVSETNSTVVALTPSVVADNQSEAEVKVTVKDINDQPAAGLKVSLNEAPKAGGNSSPILEQTTNSSGETVFKLKSSKAGQVSYEIFVDDHGVRKQLAQTATIEFIAGPVDPVSSTAVLDLAAVAANGQAQNILTVTLMDKYRNPIPGRAVQVEAPAPSIASPLQPGADTTDALGEAKFALTSTLAGELTFQIGYLPGQVGVPLKDIQAVFTAGAVDTGQSRLHLSKAKVIADGIDSAELIINLVDAHLNALSDVRLIVEDDGNSNTVSVAELIHPTDESGEARYRITNTKAEKVNLSVQMDDPALSESERLLGEQEITFIAGPMSQSNSSLHISDTSIRADRQQTAVLTAEIRDALDNPIPGLVVSLEQTGSSLIDNPSAMTDAEGIARFTVRSQKVETILYTAVIEDPQGSSIRLQQTAGLQILSGVIYQGNTELIATPSVLVADGIGTSTITVQLRDEYGNDLTEDGGSLEIYANSSPLTVTHQVYGSYSATLIAPTTTGRAILTAYLQDENGEQMLLPARQEVTFIAGPLHLPGTELRIGHSSMIADGTSQTKVFVQLRDRYGNELGENGV